MPDFKILVVDDEYGRPGRDRANFLARTKRDESDFIFSTGQNVDKRNVPEMTLDLVEQHWERQSQCRLSLILLDVRFADSQDPQANRFGFELLRTLRERFGVAVPIVMLTAESDVAPAANQATVDGFLPKENLNQISLDAQLFRNGVFSDATGKLVGNSPSFLLTLRELRRAVCGGIRELLLLGEIGTGKSDLAKYVHTISGRSERPYKTWTAVATSPDTHRLQLFGTWKGSFTDGPKEHQPGLAEMANGGTLFIDEIAELSPVAQPDLLEYAQRRSDSDNLRRVTRMGLYPKGSATNLNLVGRYCPVEDRVLVDTFLIAATNKPLDDPAWRSVSGFRQDLLSRLGHRIIVPPLRERVEDIVPLFLALFRRYSGRDITLSSEAQRQLQVHEWREGNIRELETVASVVSTRIGPEFEEIHPHHFEDLLTARSKSFTGANITPKPELREPNARSRGGTEGCVGASVSTIRFVDLEVQSKWGLAERLRTAVIETRRPGRTGTLSDIFKHATGVDYPATDVKREVKDILAPWFAPNARQAARWMGNDYYAKMAQHIRGDVVLSALYRYSAGEMTWDDASALMAGVFSGDGRGS